MLQNLDVEKAKALIMENRYKEAKDILEKVLSAEPNNQYARFEIGKILQIQGKDNLSEEEYKKVVSIDKGFQLANLELARIYYRRHSMDQALKYYKKYLADVNNNADAYREIGRVYSDMGMMKESLEFLEKAIGLGSDNTDSLFELGRSYREKGDDKNAAGIFRRIMGLPFVKKDKFLYNKALNELETTERKEFLESKVRSMIAMITSKCNIKCRICEIWKSDWQEPERTMEELVRWFPYIEDICWQGGEVFMMKGFDDILQEGTRHKNMKQVIFTNGLMINEKILNKLSKGKLDIVFSIDSANKETYESIRYGAKYERLIKVLELIREFRKNGQSNIKIYFNPVIMKSNSNELVDFMEFAKKYEFDAVTFTPIRGEYGAENIFDRKDKKALNTINKLLPKAMAKADEYGLRLNNWLPMDCGCGEGDKKTGKGIIKSGKTVAKIEVNNRMICYSPWQRLLLDSRGHTRPFAFCSDLKTGRTSNMTLEEIWNGELIRTYRRKIANNDFKGLCQPECISGQVREKICNIV